MVSKYDHENMALSYAGNLVSACASPSGNGVPCEVDIAYLFDDEHLMTAVEKDLFVQYLNEFKMAGETIRAIDPVRVGLDIDMTVVIDDGETDPDISLQIQEIVEERTMKLGGVFYMGEIVRKVSQLNGVLRVYLEHPSSDYDLDCREYLALDLFDVKLTGNDKIQIQHDPSNEGYIES